MSLLPWPHAVDRGSGATRLPSARIDPTFDDVQTDRLARAVGRLAADLARSAGLPIEGGESLPVRIRCARAGAPCPGVEEDESYWLVVDDAGVYLDAATEWGVLRGLATLGQLVTSDGRLPHVAVDDRPRFPWRGLMLDSARHFLSAATLERTVDGMARCKLNVLHLHLSDDQGFRFPVEALPELASTDAYTRAELEALVDFAAERGIRVVPEIDMPGHVTSWLTAYPEWGAKRVEPSARFGVHPGCLDPANESVYAAIGAILDALVSVFPDPCIHIGGDEVAPGWWSESEAVAALMDREGLETIKDVQGYFNRRVGNLVIERGRRVIGWDEVLCPSLPTDWIVQAWRGATARDRARARGNDAVVSAPYYLDLFYPADVHYGCDPADPQTTGLAMEDALLSDSRFAHVAGGMAWTRQWREGAVDLDTSGASAGPSRGRVLGGEACLWGELVTDELLDLRLWTRLPAVAERFWSPRELEDLRDLHRRLDDYLRRIHPLSGL
ncbi:MAG: family 20 glycosylhydrolase, partial [Gammaproteobacteria bacterium]